MTILEQTEVRRKPSKQSERDFKKGNIDGVRLTDDGSLQLTFSASASGGTSNTPGRTDYRIKIGLQDFAVIIEGMCRVDREAALLAAASILVPHLTAIKEKRDKTRARELKAKGSTAALIEALSIRPDQKTP